MKYHARIMEVPQGPDGLVELNADLENWVAAGWRLHSQSMTVVSTGVSHELLVMLVYERDDTGTLPPTGPQ
jgi:hypothetical protein